TFGLKGGYDAGVKLVANLKLFSHLANIGDTRSLVIHSASTTHRQLTDEQRIAAGAGPDVVRLSIGLEDKADIIADLEQALAAVSADQIANSRCAGPRRAPGLEFALDEGGNQRPRDGLLTRHPEAIGVLTLQHQPDVVARKPARVDDLVGIDRNVGRLGDPNAADHQRVRERPRLGRVEADLADLDVGLLLRPPPDRTLDVLAGFDEARERGPHLLREARFMTQQTAVVWRIDDQHDHDRIGAREVLLSAGPTLAPPATIFDQRGAAAVSTTARVLVPAGQRLGEPEQRQLLRRQHTLHGE